MALEDLGVGAAPTGTGTTTKTPIKVGAGYQATKTRDIEYDALGRIIVPDGAPIADPNKEVNRSKAVMELRSTAKMTPEELNSGPKRLGVGDKDFRGRKIVPDNFQGPLNPKTTVRLSDAVQPAGTQKEPQETVSKGLARTQTQTYGVDPQYFEGDQYRPASQPPEKIAELQRKMIEAGVLPKGYTTFGRWDDASSAAYQKILGYANAQGATDDEIMEQWKKFGAADGPPAKKLVVKNPDEIAATVRAAAAKVLGRSLNESEVKQLVEGYQQLDRTQQEKDAAANSAVDMGVDAEAPAPISVDTYVTNKVRTDHKGESQFMTGVDRMNTFYGMLGEAV